METSAESRKIRFAQPEDAPRCADIAAAAWERVWTAQREMLGEELYQLHNPDPEGNKRQQVQSFVTEYSKWTLVTEITPASGSPVIAGFITFVPHPDRGIAEIGNNGVDPAFQGRGIGIAQCREALRVLREMGILSVSVYTGLDEGHAPARAMYEKAGFDRSTPHVRYYLKL